MGKRQKEIFSPGDARVLYTAGHQMRFRSEKFFIFFHLFHMLKSNSQRAECLFLLALCVHSWEMQFTWGKACIRCVHQALLGVVFFLGKLFTQMNPAQFDSVLSVLRMQVGRCFGMDTNTNKKALTKCFVCRLVVVLPVCGVSPTVDLAKITIHFRVLP